MKWTVVLKAGDFRACFGNLVKIDSRLDDTGLGTTIC
jgi:hypothetical protein